MKSLIYAFFVLLIGASCAVAASPIICQGEARGRLQGFDSDGKFIYWSMFTNLVKTDFSGRVLAQRPVDPHHGDCCVHDGKVYVATQNRTKERRGVFINVYSCEDLRPVAEFLINFPFEGGIDGITHTNGFFYVGEGKPKDSTQPYNWVHQFRPDFVAVAKTKVPGQTAYGIQTITFALPTGPVGEPRMMVVRNIKKENGNWTASAAPAILKDGRLVMEK